MSLYARVAVAVAVLMMVLRSLANAASPGGSDPAGALRRLTSEPGIEAMPSWSPNGNRIVFHARRAAAKENTLPVRKVWIVDRDGANAHPLSDGIADEYHAELSPDGTKIAFVSEANGSRDVWVMDADGKNPLPLTDAPGLEEHPAWSPGGRQIAYVALPKDGGNFDLWVMNADGSGKRKLTATPANEVFPAWHPQGRTIAFATDLNGNFDIYGISLANETVSPIVTGPDNETRPAYSPDGSRIAFTRWPAEGRSEDATLWLANADGTVPTELPVPAPAVHPAWSPDGRTLAFQKKDSGDWNLWTVEIPEVLLQEGRLHLAQQVRGRGDEDMVKLRDGETIYGRISAERFHLRAPYGQVEVPRQALASIQFAGITEGTAKLVLSDGDSLSGLLLDDDIDVTVEKAKRNIRKEKIEAIGFRLDPKPEPERRGPARLEMRNGDSFGGELRSRSLRLRVASQVVEIPLTDVARVDFGEEGRKSRIVTRKGDTLGGLLETSLLEVDLEDGIYLGLYPSYVRTLTLAEEPP